MLINQPIPEKFYHSADLNLILMSALDSVDPGKCIRNVIERKKDFLRIQNHEIRLKDINKIYLFGVGKAVLTMGLEISDTLDELLEEGILITKYKNPEIQLKLNKRIKIYQGSHPIPTEKSTNATCFLLKMLRKVISKDLVIGLISGGGSALMSYPFEEIGLLELQKTTSLLLKCGATIEEMNTIRKHLDMVKGGGLLKQIHPAKSIHLILSDVLGDPLSMIASGPTTSDPTTFNDCLKIIKKYELEEKLDANVISFIKNGEKGLHDETLKDGDRLLMNHKNIIVGSLTISAVAAMDQAVKLGYEAKIITTSLRGEASVVGVDLANQFIKFVNQKKKNDKPICLIAGGETTVTVKGEGKGGRNQELALAAAQVLRGKDDCVLISFATDGEDGPTDAAGGIVTGDTINTGLKMNLNAQIYLGKNNAYEFLNKVDGLIKTGPTGTNVNDLVVMIAF
jgi:glycerate 2-kinase